MKTALWTLAAALFFSLSAVPAQAHCDTIDGPVVKAATVALDKGTIEPVLKWVKKEHEAEIREAFNRALDVRKLKGSARDLADRYFFETVVRVHRAGEGEPYTGLKPAGTPVDPVIAAADKALETGSVNALSRHISERVAHTIEARFAEASDAKKAMDTNVDAGRRYVQAYVEFVHYLEALHKDPESHHAEGSEAHGH
ncbi:MAG: DUF6448 family protein [Acidobacteriota bacterium]